MLDENFLDKADGSLVSGERAFTSGTSEPSVRTIGMGITIFDSEK